MPVTFVPARGFGPVPARPRRKPPKPKPKKPAPKKPKRDRAAETIRAAMARVLDDGFTSGALGGALWQGEDLPPEAVRFFQQFAQLAAAGDQLSMHELLQSYGLDVFQAVAATLFPELYGEAAEDVPKPDPSQRAGQATWEQMGRLLPMQQPERQRRGRAAAAG